MSLCLLTAVVRKGFGDAGLATALLSVLTSSDQELLVHAARAISRISYDSCKCRNKHVFILSAPFGTLDVVYWTIIT